jgi:hypothetical protein
MNMTAWLRVKITTQNDRIPFAKVFCSCCYVMDLTQLPNGNAKGLSQKSSRENNTSNSWGHKIEVAYLDIFLNLSEKREDV